LYEIPKIVVDVEISLFTDERISGQIFVTEDRQTDAGDPSVAEFLNQDDDVFFPFAGGGSAYRLINKPQVCYLATTQTDREARTLSKNPVLRHQVTCSCPPDLGDPPICRPGNLRRRRLAVSKRLNLWRELSCEFPILFAPVRPARVRPFPGPIRPGPSPS